MCAAGLFISSFDHNNNLWMAQIGRPKTTPIKHFTAAYFLSHLEYNLQTRYTQPAIHSPKYITNRTYDGEFPPNIKFQNANEEGLIGILLQMDEDNNTETLKGVGECWICGILHKVTVATGGNKPELLGQVAIEVG